MTHTVARLLAGLFVATLALGTPAAQAQPTPREVLQSSYAPWGMMDAMANFCWERSGYEVAYMEAHQDWLARNLVIRDAALAASGEAASLAGVGEKSGADGILQIMQQVENKDEASTNWKGEVERLGAFEAETFLAYPLGLLRERDGL